MKVRQVAKCSFRKLCCGLKELESIGIKPPEETLVIVEKIYNLKKSQVVKRYNKLRKAINFMEEIHRRDLSMEMGDILEDWGNKEID